MSDQFVAEIRIVPFNFAPRGWAFCNGQLMPISQNTALFSLLGTTYGGDGKSTFALPDLQGRAPMHPGQGPGLTLRILGEEDGAETITLLAAEMPSHSHAAAGCVGATANRRSPVGAVPARELSGVTAIYVDDATPAGAMAPQAATSAGGSLPHNNMQPYLVLNFVIALQGIFPPRP